jgi:t-SNARE complex subunit (syntaxin)
MNAGLQKIWKAVASLKQADHHTTAMCYSIINLMIRQGVVTREEATLQIEKSVAKVVALHEQIAEAIQEQSSDAGGNNGMKSLH